MLGSRRREASVALDAPNDPYMGSSHNSGPILVPLNTGCRKITYTQKGAHDSESNPYDPYVP